MTLEDLLKVILAAGSLTAGAFLTALRAKLANTKKKTWLHYIFYIVATLVLIAVLITMVVCWREVLMPNWFAITVLTIGTASSIALIWVNRTSLAQNNYFTSGQLDPVVNNFSRNADKGNIKLLAGNLDFFGLSEVQMDKHPQYACLREERFREIHILCTAPLSNEDKYRYGKILTDFPGVELRYYRPPLADLKVRGRIKTLNNVTRLLIYSKVDTGKYEALELNTAESSGALYSHLWNLIWELAQVPTMEQLIEYKKLYRPSMPQQ